MPTGISVGMRVARSVGFSITRPQKGAGGFFNDFSSAKCVFHNDP
jgi:hypothetical protein